MHRRGISPAVPMWAWQRAIISISIIQPNIVLHLWQYCVNISAFDSYLVIHHRSLQLLQFHLHSKMRILVEINKML